MLNLQEVFFKVKNHLLTQNCRSVLANNEYACAYRGNGGMKCAAGCLIPDDIYRPQFEGDRFFVLINEYFNFSDLNIEESKEMIYLIADLQNCHDNFLPSEWEEKLQSIAKLYNLAC